MRVFLVTLFLTLSCAVAVGQNRVEIQVLPPSGDPAVVTPIATLESSISPAQFCGMTQPPPPPDPALVNPTDAIYDDPFTPNLYCWVPMPMGLPDGSGYRAVAVHISDQCTDPDGNPQTNCRSLRSEVAIPTFGAQAGGGGGDPCLPAADGTLPVRLIVGNWVRTAAPGNVGWVSFSLLLSTAPITELVVNFNGVEQDRLTGSDLRKVFGSYFQVNEGPGSYQLSVEARDANGCSDGANRPMTVVVQ
jgi:hypothetical protein